MSVQNRLVWMDLEMTGLDVERERIIEIAVIVTEGDLSIVAEGPSLVIKQPDTLLAAMDEWNTKHHRASGLTARVKASTTTEVDAEAAVMAFLQQHTEKGAPLAGNSVHQDRRFLARFMPAIDEWLHYRHVDVSTLKELCVRWYPEVHQRRPRKTGAHRALDDLKESIEELAYYRAQIFREVPGTDPDPDPEG